MMMKFSWLVLIVVVTVSVEGNTVDELDVDKYTGRWYQAYGNRMTEVFGPGYVVCSIADYGKQNATTVTVRNTAHRDEVSGEFVDARGYAFATEEPGKFLLDLGGFPILLDYWVLKLGPVNEDGLYDYSIVSDSVGVLLYILARDMDVFRDKYEDEALTFARENGYTDYLREPLSIYHGDDCRYVERPKQ